MSFDVVTRGLRIVGAHDTNPPPVASDYAHWSHAEMAALFFTYLSRKQMDVASLISRGYDARAAVDAYSLLLNERATTMGVILDWTQIV
ncbi:MAG: hypothetical protein U0X20_16840 [Caldilineaceae bacterium]